MFVLLTSSVNNNALATYDKKKIKKNYASHFQNIYVALRISSWKLATEKSKNTKKIEKSGEEEKVDEEVWA